MTTALWIIGILTLLFGGAGFWLFKTCGNTDGDMGQGLLAYFSSGVAALGGVIWIILILIKLRRFL